MKIPKQARRSAKALYQSCLVDSVLDENRARRVVEEVVNAKPRGYLPILNQFHRLVKLDVQRRSATIESPTEMTSDDKRQIEAQLLARYGRGMTYEYRINPALIAGLRIQVGSDVYDGSVAGRLRALQESFRAA